MAPQTDLDHAALFDRLQSILNELYGRVTDRLSVSPHLNPNLQNFSSPDGAITGSLETFSGSEIDWLVFSWLNSAQLKFSTMRLTCWLSPQMQVPHLAIELGAIPHPFFYIDYIPRVDLWTNLAYVERYYELVQPTYLELRNNPDLSVFVSKALYVRQVQSPAHLCFTCPSTESSLALIQQTAQEMCDRWLSWVEQAESVPAAEQDALAKRDLLMRRISAERDPGNAMIAKIFGSEFANQLVRSLWGKEQ